MYINTFIHNSALSDMGVIDLLHTFAPQLVVVSVLLIVGVIYNIRSK